MSKSIREFDLLLASVSLWGSCGLNSNMDQAAFSVYSLNSIFEQMNGKYALWTTQCNIPLHDDSEIWGCSFSWCRSFSKQELLCYFLVQLRVNELSLQELHEDGSDRKKADDWRKTFGPLQECNRNDTETGYENTTVVQHTSTCVVSSTVKKQKTCTSDPSGFDICDFRF